MKTIIERGASWTLEETKMLLALWGQDLVQRQATNMKRTKEVYEKISEKFNQSGFERTADQVRTRVFNMIAEYRRILKDPNPERMKKCIFFDALHKIYQAKHMDDIKSALDDYEPEYPYSPEYPPSNAISSEKGDESVSDSEATDGNETTINNTTQGTNNNTNNKSGTNNAANDNNNGDSNNNNNSNTTGKDSPKSNHEGRGHAPSVKRIKVQPVDTIPNWEDLEVTDSHAGTAAAAASTSSANTNSSSSGRNNANAKQIKTSSSNNSTPNAQANSSLAGPSASTSSSSNSTAQRHQSLLLPHATTPSSITSTPITSKITTSGSNNTPSYININNNKLPIFRAQPIITHPNGNESINLNGTNARLPTTAAAITGHQLYQAPVNTFDVTSSALLIDRMFAHLSRESENMREWIALEKERLALERTRRQQEIEREVRRERVLTDTLMRFQEQWLAFLSQIDPRIVENSAQPLPELKIPPKESSSSDTPQSTQPSQMVANTQPSTSSNSSATTTTTTTTTSDASK